jgi:hypothetical protein
VTTRAYLEAAYQLDRAILSNADASRSAEATLAETLGDECHGVLAGEPNEEFGPSGRGSESPRAKGERQRSEQQAQTINQEISLAFFGATESPDRAAVEAYSAAITPLRWSNPQIAPLAQFYASALTEQVVASVASVCADMRAWALSGYHVLSTASREFETAALKASSERHVPSGSITALLKPYEDAGDRRLIRETKALESKVVIALFAGSRMFARLQRALGAPEGPLEEQAQEPVLAHGTTHAGSTFTVRRKAPGGSFGPPCAHSVSVEFTAQHKGQGLISIGNGTSVCLGARSDRQPSIGCSGGVESLTASVPASVHTVQLQLSDGQKLTTRVVRIPRKSGGPGGVYVEAVHGSSPYPVSLTELDAQGNVVKVLELRRVHCRKEPRPQGPTFVDLAKGNAPGGEPFTIEATIVHFGHKQTSFSLSSVGSELRGTHEEGGLRLGVKPKAFPWSLSLECPPHEFAIIYGILSAPGDSVLARTSAGLVPLTKVELAADLHSGGPLVYGAFSTMPSELVVLRSDGLTLYSESLTARTHEEAEFCAGYAEP